jgi:hypothetical protein
MLMLEGVLEGEVLFFTQFGQFLLEIIRACLIDKKVRCK